MLACKELTVSYGSVTALHNVSLNVQEGGNRRFAWRKWRREDDPPAYPVGPCQT